MRFERQNGLHGQSGFTEMLPQKETFTTQMQTFEINVTDANKADSNKNKNEEREEIDVILNTLNDEDYQPQSREEDFARIFECA